MIGLIRSEIRKLTTVWTTWILTAVGVLFAVIGAAFFVFESEFSGEFTGTDAQVAAVIDQVGGASAFVLVIAILLVTTEFRHGTIGRTLQLEPSRTRMLLSKLTIGVLYSLVFAVIGTAVVLLLALASGVGLTFGDETLTALWNGPVGLALTAMLGIGLGALLRSQVVAVTLSLVWIFLVENLVNQFFPEIARWLPFQALNALFLSDELMASMPEGMVQPLEPTAALLVFVGYVVLTVVPAVLLLRYRDV